MSKPTFPPLRIIREGQLPEGTEVFSWKELLNYWWYWIAVLIFILEWVLLLSGVGI